MIQQHSRWDRAVVAFRGVFDIVTWAQAFSRRLVHLAAMLLLVQSVIAGRCKYTVLVRLPTR